MENQTTLFAQKTIPPSAYRKSHIYWGLFALLQLLLVTVAFAAGFLYRQWFYNGDDFTLFYRALNVLKENGYYDLPNTRELEYGMIKGLLEAYNDPYTVFVEPPQHELQTNQLQGRFGGIGVRMERDGENYVHLYPLPDSPAARAGILEGDLLLGVDGIVITPDMPTDTIQAAIRGPVGESVTIVVGRSPDFKPITLKMKRAEVPLPSVTWNLAPEESRVGVIQINVIADTTPNEVTNAIKDLQERGATHFILDVRNNGGGLVDAGVNTARLFLKEGAVIQQQYRGEDVKTYSVSKPGPFTDLPLVVLTNKGTASAAEILAGALQGQGRARLVGDPTFGKDSIQLVFDLGDGSSMHVTAARWWIPGLAVEIKANGLQPDVLAPESDSENPPLQKAIEVVLSQ